MRTVAATSFPETCGIALKEWAGVCQALRDGRQTVLLRKGGVAEERGTFRPEHEAFWLFPTWSHEAAQGLREGFHAQISTHFDYLMIDLLAVAERVVFLDDLAVVERLAPLTAWTMETLERRFHYRRPGLWAIAVRVYRREDPWFLEAPERFGGCRSWVALDGPIDVGDCRPVLTDGDQQSRLGRILDAIGQPMSSLEGSAGS